jgi:glycolate oxidase FAD binding subunit
MTAPDAALQRLVEQVRDACRRQAPLDIRGGGSKAFYGGIPRGERLQTCELSGITSHEPTELVVTVRAGTPLAELEAALAEHGQCLPFEPPRFGGGDERDAAAAGGTVGGMVAAGLSGPARANVGSMRDHLLGASLLNGNGEVLGFGGQVIKNVAGYDVSRLLAGSLGILGVICEVSLKVLPLPTAGATLVFDADEQRAQRQLSEWARRPLPLSATAWHRQRLFVRLSGAHAAVQAACASLGGTTLAAGAADAWWRDVRDHRHAFFLLDAAALARGECLWRMSVPATAAPIGLAGDSFIEWGGAQRWLRTDAPALQVRAAAAKAGGHAVLFRAADKSAGVFAPLAEPLMRIHQGLKRAFDPAGILNPGRLYPGL